MNGYLTKAIKLISSGLNLLYTLSLDLFAVAAIQVNETTLSLYLSMLTPHRST